MNLTKEDKKWLVKLATIVMNHLVWIIHLSRTGSTIDVMEDWSGSAGVSWKEKTKELLK